MLSFYSVSSEVIVKKFGYPEKTRGAMSYTLPNNKLY